MLGLFLHSPLRQVTPLYDEHLNLLRPSPPYHLPDIETVQMLKAISTMETRTRAVLSLSLSFPHMFTPPSLLPLCLPITHVYSGESFVLGRGYRLTICQA